MNAKVQFLTFKTLSVMEDTNEQQDEGDTGLRALLGLLGLLRSIEKVTLLVRVQGSLIEEVMWHLKLRSKENMEGGEKIG